MTKAFDSAELVAGRQSPLNRYPHPQRVALAAGCGAISKIESVIGKGPP